MVRKMPETSDVRSMAFTVSDDLEDVRADKGISEYYEDISRSRIARIIKSGEVLINGIACKSDTLLHAGDNVSFNLPAMVIPDILPEDIPLDILYEDEDVLVVNKPKGMVVHPAAGHYSGTLVNALMYHCKDLSGINGVMRPGIVHRIDMDTTGSLIVCKNDFAHNDIAGQLKTHSINRKYIAIVHGVISSDEGVISAPIGRHPTERKKMAVNVPHAREAVTHYRVLKRFRDYTYVECRLETGRTHQIRVHMAYINHPLLGDEVYCHAKTPYVTQGQVLHAMVLGFIQPHTREYIEITAPIPAYFEELLKKLPI